jgi:hypothetical protein
MTGVLSRLAGEKRRHLKRLSIVESFPLKKFGLSLFVIKINY